MVTVNLANNGSFNIINNDLPGNNLLVSFDSQGNAFFAGELMADVIRVNRIEGLEEQIASLSAEIKDSLNLNVFGNFLTQQTTFKGETFFEKITQFLGDIIFVGRPTFNKDTAGYAVVKRGQRKVEVKFEKEYEKPPVVTASLIWDLDEATASVADKLSGFFVPSTSYAVTSVSTKGFIIFLDEQAVTNLKFSWIALAVKDAVTFESPETIATPTPEVTIISSPTPIEVPTETPVPTPTFLPNEEQIEATESAQ